MKTNIITILQQAHRSCSAFKELHSQEETIPSYSASEEKPVRKKKVGLASCVEFGMKKGFSGKTKQVAAGGQKQFFAAFWWDILF